jgi:hypothetical protein
VGYVNARYGMVDIFMWTTQHLVISIVPAFMYGFFTNDWFNATLFYLTCFAVDVDHLFVSLATRKEYDILKLFNEYKNTYEEKNKNTCFENSVCHPFHVVEFIVVLALLSYYVNSVFTPILFGASFHILSDVATVAWKKDKRIFSAIFFLVRYLRGL